MSDTNDMSSKPGSGIAAAKRASKVAPPPPPPPAAEPAAEDVPAQPEPEAAPTPKAAPSKPAKAKKSKPKAPPETEEPKLLGRPAGRLRQVLVHLRKDTRVLLDQSVRANASSLGVEAMNAIRAAHQQLRDETPPPAADDGFAPARRVVRQMPRGEAKVPTTLTITPAEAEALQDLAAAVSASVAVVVDDCIRRHHTPQLADER